MPKAQTVGPTQLFFYRPITGPGMRPKQVCIQPITAANSRPRIGPKQLPRRLAKVPPRATMLPAPCMLPMQNFWFTASRRALGLMDLPQEPSPCLITVAQATLHSHKTSPPCTYSQHVNVPSVPTPIASLHQLLFCVEPASMQSSLLARASYTSLCSQALPRRTRR